MRALRRLAEDGLELLGDIDVGGRVVIGDPARFASEGGAVRVAAVPGRWLVFGRAWERDPDELAEIVLVLEARIDTFYDQYDALVPAGEAEIGGRRVAVLDATVANDPDVLASLYEPDELPWVLAAGLVAAEGPGSPARVWVTGEPATLVMLALGPAPAARAASPDLTVDDEQG